MRNLVCLFVGSSNTRWHHSVHQTSARLDLPHQSHVAQQAGWAGIQATSKKVRVSYYDFLLLAPWQHLWPWLSHLNTGSQSLILALDHNLILNFNLQIVPWHEGLRLELWEHWDLSWVSRFHFDIFLDPRVSLYRESLLLVDKKCKHESGGEARPPFSILTDDK